MTRECRRYMDDYPGARADCERAIAAGSFCPDCPKNPKSDAHRIAELEAALRRHAIGPHHRGGGKFYSCDECGAAWAKDDAERHVDGCLAALRQSGE